MDYIFKLDDGTEAIAHHGIKGMKWGVWNAETAARRTGNHAKRAKMLEKGMSEMERQHDRSSKYHEKASTTRYKAEHGRWGKSKSKKLANYSRKASKYMAKADKGNNVVKGLKYQAKANKVQAKMTLGTNKSIKYAKKAVKSDIKRRQLSELINEHYDTPMGNVTERQKQIGRAYMVKAFSPSA